MYALTRDLEPLFFNCDLFTAKINIKTIIDLMSGKRIHIVDTRFANILLSFKGSLGKEFRDEFLIDLKFDFNYQLIRCFDK